MVAFSLLMLSAFAAGMLNAVAGGGSFLTFPALMMAGVPAVAANASSTVALFPGQLASAWAYRHDTHGVADVSVPVFAGLSLVGGLLGALILLFTPNAVFVQLVPWLMLFATVVFAIGNFAPAGTVKHFRLGGRAILVVQFIISIYGGYFGGGIGVLMLAALTLYGMRDIHAMNGLKIMLASLMNGIAVIAFAVAGVVHWPETFAMALASMVGGYVGVLGAKRAKPKLIKGFVVVLGVTLTVYFFVRAG